MARVKVVMGFVVLAAMLKYLASVDQVLQWNVITRERFLAAWIVLFAMAGLYLLGFLRLEGIAKDEPMGLGRLLTGMVFLIFAISLAPGMSGGKLGELDAYIPVASGGGSGGGGGNALVWMKDQYREALDRARREGKLVLVDLHRLCLHQLPLDEGQHVYAAGDRGRGGELRAGGIIHRRHGRSFAGQSGIGAEQIPDYRHPVLRDCRRRWQRHRHLSGRDPRRGRLPGIPAEREGGLQLRAGLQPRSPICPACRQPPSTARR